MPPGVLASRSATPALRGAPTPTGNSTAVLFPIRRFQVPLVLLRNSVKL
jgi:hypothetical protein